MIACSPSSAASGATTSPTRTRPRRITGGFDTTIYGFRLSGTDGDLAQPLIVRIYGPEAHERQATFETVMHNTLAGLGYPTPRILAGSTDATLLGTPFVIMPRVPGRVMLASIFGPRAPDTARTLGTLHARLHALDAAELRRALEAAGVDSMGWEASVSLDWMRTEIDALRLDGLRDALDWLIANRPPAPARLAICHGDFHPLNIMMDGRTVSGVLDWAGARIGDPAWDVGATLALFGQGPVGMPAPVLRAIGVLRRWLLGRYIRAYSTAMPLDMDAVRYYEAYRCTLFLVEGGQHRQALAGVIPPLVRPTAFHAKPVLDGIARRVTQITGVSVSLPPEKRSSN